MVEEHDGISYIEHEGERLAVTSIPGTAPGIFFLPGFGSDMTGGKATYLAELARQCGIAFTAMDYSGHGQSSGAFRDGTLTSWLSDALAVFDHATKDQQIVVGSSMGGWLALHLALARRERLHALVGIAAAPDFTEDLIRHELNEDQKQALETVGFIEVPSEYGSPTIITRALVESGQVLRLLHAPIAITCPVRLLHGMQDRDVPWKTSLRLVEALESQDVQVHLVKDGEHRLSRESDLAALWQIVKSLSQAAEH